jgi:ABC-type transport system involved in multi-copper enzyme maturation permease subunit
MIADRVRELVTANPMLVEITRFRRRFFSFSTGNSMNSVIFTLCLIGYAIVVLFVMENAGSIAPIYVVMVQTGVLTILAPMMLYGSIASERERRSWDLLMAAPITKAQVVAGKFIGAMSALGIAVVMFLVPILIAASGVREDTFYGRGLGGISISNLINAEFVSITFLMAVCAMTILFSARVKRGLMALGATLGILSFRLVVVPVFLMPGAGSDPMMGDVSMFFHPWYVMARLQSPMRSTVMGTTVNLPPLWGWIQSVVYFGMAIVLLGWAANTLHFAENEVRFLPQGEKNA